MNQVGIQIYIVFNPFCIPVVAIFTNLYLEIESFTHRFFTKVSLCFEKVLNHFNVNLI